MGLFSKDLGVGVGLRSDHYRHFIDRRPDSVSWVEVISENFMDWEKRELGRSLSTLLKVRRNLPIVLHGVSLSIGSADPVQLTYLSRLKELARRLEPEWISDHLCWTGVDGRNLHDLLPIPYTEFTLDFVAEKLSLVQEFLGRRILIENPSSYLEYSASEMSECEFLAEVSRRADCGILLDINNVYVSSVNHGFDPISYLETIPSERVGQIHLAGHSNKGGFLVDTHDAPVCLDVWELYAWAVRYFGKVSVMLERDSNIPAWEELESELIRISEIRQDFSTQEPISEQSVSSFASASIQ